MNHCRNTLTENMFPMCLVGIIVSFLYLKGSHNITFVSSEPDARIL